MKQVILITIRVEQVPARLRPYLSNRMVLEGEHISYKLYQLYTIYSVYIYIYTQYIQIF